MERSVVAFAPGHISGYFRRVDGKTAAETGSLGAGMVIARGVTVTMKPSAHPNARVTSGEEPHLLLDAMELLGVSADITATAEMPIGAGFGMSAAGLLAAACAANRLFDLGMTEDDIVRFAHIYEVEHDTGLGDAAAEAGGGIDVRTVAGYRGVTARINDTRTVSAVTLGPMSTPDIISSPDIMNRVSAAFPAGTPQTLDDVIKMSRTFAEHSGLITPAVRRILDICDAHRIPASMTMLGEGVFALGDTAGQLLAQFGTVYTFTAASRGPYICSEVK